MDIGKTDDNVVVMPARRQVQPDALRLIETYWLALADGRLMPKRSEIDPRGLIGALDRIFLLEQIAPTHARFRVAGSRLSQLLDMDLRGMPMSALFHPTARPDLADALACLFGEPARLRLRLDGVGGMFTARIPAELLMLPLRDDEGGVTRALGVLDWTASVTAPIRFRIGHQDRRTLIGFGERRQAVDAPKPDAPETGQTTQPGPDSSGPGDDDRPPGGPTAGPGARRRPDLNVVT